MEHLVRILSSFTNYEKIRDFHKGRVRVDLKNMERVVRAAGRPHEKTPCIHITGSKGKGSTALMTAAILKSQGFKTGVFTSPHLVKMNERIAVNGRPLSDEAFLQAADRALEVLRADDTLMPTYFEFITITAMMAFEGLDAAVYEVGLGGRLDATNVVLPEVSVITTVELEHCAVLGDTEETIALEKAGIIKPGVPVVTTVPLESPARAVIESRARELGAPLHGPRVTGDGWVESNGERTGPFRPPRPEKLQARNLAAAVAAARIFTRRQKAGWHDERARAALHGLKLPGRFEVIDPRIIVDGAHTLCSIEATLASAAEVFPDGLSVILGLAEDKEAAPIVRAAVKAGHRLIFTSYPGGRAEDPCNLNRMAGGRGIVASSPKEALEEARRGDAGILVTGSFYLAGAVKALLSPDERSVL
jgi:dihydrofolate synthase/folylpolyglutamate synthase